MECQMAYLPPLHGPNTLEGLGVHQVECLASIVYSVTQILHTDCVFLFFLSDNEECA